MELSEVNKFELTNKEIVETIKSAKKTFLEISKISLDRNLTNISYGMCTCFVMAIINTLNRKCIIRHVHNEDIFKYIPHFNPEDLDVVKGEDFKIACFWWDSNIEENDYAIKVREKAFDKLLSYYL